MEQQPKFCSVPEHLCRPLWSFSMAQWQCDKPGSLHLLWICRLLCWLMTMSPLHLRMSVVWYWTPVACQRISGIWQMTYTVGGFVVPQLMKQLLCNVCQNSFLCLMRYQHHFLKVTTSWPWKVIDAWWHHPSELLHSPNRQHFISSQWGSYVSITVFITYRPENLRSVSIPQGVL